MRIENLLRTIESYLKSRTAIIRRLNDRQMKPGELEATTRVPYAMLFRRRQNAAHWRSSELKRLAETLGLSPDPIRGIETLAEQIDTLPDLIRVALLKEARISLRRLVVRMHDSDHWQCDELDRLAVVLRQWQDAGLTSVLPIIAQK